MGAIAPPAATASSPPARGLIGRVVSISGAYADLSLAATHPAAEEDQATVGKFAGIITGRSAIIGLISEAKRRVSSNSPRRAPQHRAARIDRRNQKSRGRIGGLSARQQQLSKDRRRRCADERGRASRDLWRRRKRSCAYRRPTTEQEYRCPCQHR